MRHAAVVLAFVLGVGAAVAGAQDAPWPATLSASQRVVVEMGKPVQVLEDVAGSPWPRSIVYQFIDATPEECAAVLSDFALQSAYIPRLRTSRVIRTSGADTDVEYVVDIPLYPDERSVSRQRVIVSGSIYGVVWRTVIDSQVNGSRTSGNAAFLPVLNASSGKHGTLMIHDQTVIPASMFSKVSYVRNKAIESDRLAAVAIARQIEQERAKYAGLLRTQMRRLRAAVQRDTAGLSR